MAYNWLMMASSGDDNWPSGTSSAEVGYSYRQKEKNKTAVRFKPRIKAHGYSNCPTALLLLFLSLCERLARET